MSDKVDYQLIKTINERRILSLIRNEGPISRNRIAKATRLSKVAVSSIINRLDEEGYILDIGKGDSTVKGGKRPSLLKLNPDNGFAIGIQFKRGNTTIALANIESEIIDIENLTFINCESIDDILENVFEKIDLLIDRHHVDRDKLINIGIGIPGLIDYKNGRLLFSVTYRNWVNLPLASRFSERYNVPVVIENDVNTITLSESIMGAGRGQKNIVCILLESGIGAGFIMDGYIIRGESSRAGEVGYFELGDYISHINRMENLYNNQRYFGEVLSEVNLHDTLRVKLLSDQSIDAAHMSLSDMILLGEKGNFIVQEIMNEYAYPLAVICLNLIQSLNPGLLIMSGRIIESSSYLFRKVIQLVNQSMINLPFEACPIVLGQLGNRASVTGAIAMALQSVFEPPLKRNDVLQQHY